MQQLTSKLREIMDAAPNGASQEQVADLLQKAAEDWALFCLRDHADTLLDKGLGISKAIVDYLWELKGQQ